MKECIRCRRFLPLEAYGKYSRKKDGLRADCKECLNSRAVERNSVRREEIRNRVNKWASQNRDKTRNYYHVGKESRREQRRKQSRLYREANPEKCKAQARKTYLKNRDRVLERTKNRPKHINVYYTRMYQLRRSRACPKWLSAEQRKEIKWYYEMARFMSESFLVNFHVDHIVPLKGKTVCGLHVPWNLQILTATENCEKSNNHG